MRPLLFSMDNEEKLNAWNSELTAWLVPNNVFLSLYLIIGTFGNLLVLLTYSFRMDTSKDDRYFIPSLAALDLLACVIGSSYALSLNLLPVRFSGNALCKLLWFLSQCTTISSSLILLVIAIQRYFKVCKPLTPKWSLKRKRIAVFLAVSVSIIISVPTFAFYGEIPIFNSELNVTGYRCSHVHDDMFSLDWLIVYNIFLFITALAGIVIISIMYTLVGKSIYTKVIMYRKSFRRPKRVPQPVFSVSADGNCTAFHKENSISAETKSDNLANSDYSHEKKKQKELETRKSAPAACQMSTKQRESRSRISRDLLHVPVPHMKSHLLHYRYSYMFMTIAVVFVISYLPRIIIMLLESVSETFWIQSDRTIAALLFLYRMYILNHVTNPFIYGFFDGSFRHEVKMLFCKCRGKSKDHTLTKSSS